MPIIHFYINTYILALPLCHTFDISLRVITREKSIPHVFIDCEKLGKIKLVKGSLREHIKIPYSFEYKETLLH